MSLGIQEEAKHTGKVHCLCVKGRMCRYREVVVRNLDSAHLKKAGHSCVTLGKNINITLNSPIDMKEKEPPFYSVTHRDDF